MKQITLQLDKNGQRPIVMLKQGLKALLDTGAFVPVWIADEDILISDLGAKFVKAEVPFSGFGGTTTGNLYSVTMQIGELIYPNIPVLANAEMDATFDWILSASMFEGLLYQIDTVNHMLNIDVPDNESMVRNIRLKDDAGQLFVLSENKKSTDT